MASIKQPIKDILAKLATITVTNADLQVAPVHARIWNNQIKKEETGQMYDFVKPAVFVEVIGNVQWDQLGIGFRSADLGFHIHVVVDQYDAQDGTMEQNLTVFDLRDKVVAAISNMVPTGCGPVWSTAELQDYDHTNIYHYIISFVCNFTDSIGSQYDPGAGVYIDSAAPTILQATITKQ
jgi:hypothetical protein